MSQPDAFIGCVGGETTLVERLEHARDGTGQHAERGRDLSGRDCPGILGIRKLIDCFDVVLDRQAGHGRLSLSGQTPDHDRLLPDLRQQRNPYQTL